jgi:plastocyanin
MAKTYNIDIKELGGDMVFDPAAVSISTGDTVVWKNQMDFEHTATADDGSFDSKHIKPNTTFSHTFTSAGSVPYHCDIHPFMTGTITVA